MSRVDLACLLLVFCVCPVSLTVETKPTPVTLIGDKDCSAVVNGTGEIINLEPLQRTDGHPRYTASFEYQDQQWNYSFNPCSPYTLPFENPHNDKYGDHCHSVSFCNYRDTGERRFFYALGVQEKVFFRGEIDEEDGLHVELVYKGLKSMRHQVTIVELVCDETKKTVDDGVFTIVGHKEGRDEQVRAELHHKCCCPNGCLGKSLDGPKARTKSGMLLILVGTVVTLLFVAAIIGGLCYVKRTQLQIYYKLPGLHNVSSNPRSTSIEQNVTNSPVQSRKNAFRDYEPASTVHKKLLPVLDDAIISEDSIELGQRLGGGIFGDTHVATWRDMRVAVKRLTINVHGNQVTEATMEFMKSEVWFLSRQRHKNIVTIVGLCLDGKHPYIITEYVSGENLKDFLKAKGSEVTWPQRIKMCNNIADGMAFLHSTKPPIIHRDLRCGNLFLLEDDLIKVADFGLVKLLQPVRQECNQDDCCCRRQYSACPAGLQWTAPELLSHPAAQEDDAIITTSCDVYSFGVVLWEIIVGKDPFEELHTEQEVIDAVKGGKRPLVPSTAEMMPQYKELMKDCWVQEPHNRPTFKQVAVRLKEISHQARSFQKVVNNRQKREQSPGHIV